MISNSLREFIDRVIDKGQMNERDVLILRDDVFSNGPASRAEADALIALDRLVTVPEGWSDFLVNTILGFTLRQSTVSGNLPADFVNWLISSLDIGQPTERAIRIAAAVVEEAHCADEYLRRFAKMTMHRPGGPEPGVLAA